MDNQPNLPAADGTRKQRTHIVDTLIEERAEKLRRSRLWPFYRSILYPILLYKQAVKMADGIANLAANDVFDYASDLLDLSVDITGAENIPRDGRILIACTHPTGISDGIVVYDAIKAMRSDITYFANRDAIRVAPKLIDMIIPVEWVEEKRTRLRSRETLVATKKAFNDEKCVVLFPSGRLAYMNENKVLTEQEWLPSVAIFAKKYNCSIVPAHIEGRNSWLYYWFWKLSDELRDITLFHELLNKKGQRFKIKFGPAIHPEALDGDSTEVTAALREHAVENVPANIAWRPLN